MFWNFGSSTGIYYWLSQFELDTIEGVIDRSYAKRCSYDWRSNRQWVLTKSSWLEYYGVRYWSFVCHTMFKRLQYWLSQLVYRWWNDEIIIFMYYMQKDNLSKISLHKNHKFLLFGTTFTAHYHVNLPNYYCTQLGKLNSYCCILAIF